MYNMTIVKNYHLFPVISRRHQKVFSVPQSEYGWGAKENTQRLVYSLLQLYSLIQWYRLFYMGIVSP